MVVIEWLLDRAGLASAGWTAALFVAGGVAAGLAAPDDAARGRRRGRQRVRSRRSWCSYRPRSGGRPRDAFYAGISAWAITLVVLASGRQRPACRPSCGRRRVRVRCHGVLVIRTRADGRHPGRGVRAPGDGGDRWLSPPWLRCQCSWRSRRWASRGSPGFAATRHVYWTRRRDPPSLSVFSVCRPRVSSPWRSDPRLRARSRTLRDRNTWLLVGAIGRGGRDGGCRAECRRAKSNASGCRSCHGRCSRLSASPRRLGRLAGRRCGCCCRSRAPSWWPRRYGRSGERADPRAGRRGRPDGPRSCRSLSGAGGARSRRRRRRRQPRSITPSSVGPTSWSSI